jgi:hypothetical protein
MAQVKPVLFVRSSWPLPDPCHEPGIRNALREFVTYAVDFVILRRGKADEAPGAISIN